MLAFLYYALLLLVCVNAGRDFYKILGVDRNANDRQLKKAYRKLSLKYHPDRCKEDSCHEKFTDVNAAYECLSDKEKRQIFNRRGEEGVKEHEKQGGGGGFHDPFGMFRRRQRDDSIPKGENTRIVIDVPLKVLYSGDIIEAEFERDVLCSRWDECEIDDSECSGPGVRTKTQRIGPGFMQQFQQQDDRCIARGKRYNPRCSACPDGATVKDTTPITIDIEPGMKHGQEIVFEDVGDESIGKSPGNLIVVLREQAHPYFTRDGDNLRLRLGITLTDALVGFETTIKHVDGHEVRVKSSSVINCEHVMKIRGEGMPRQTGTGLGDLIITFDIEFPRKTFSETQKKNLRRILT